MKTKKEIRARKKEIKRTNTLLKILSNSGNNDCIMSYRGVNISIFYEMDYGWSYSLSYVFKYNKKMQTINHNRYYDTKTDCFKNAIKYLDESNIIV